jgi:integrase
MVGSAALFLSDKTVNTVFCFRMKGLHVPKLNSRLPGYRLHKASGRAVVTLSSKDYYLGPHGSDTSKAEYDRLTAAWLAAGRKSLEPTEEPTIAEMLVRYWRFAGEHYRKNGKPTHEIVNIRSAIRPLRELFGRELVREFGPLKLKAIQARLVTGHTDGEGNFVDGLSRRTINARIGSLKRVFAWAVSEELAPPQLAHALATVRGLQRGRTEAREPSPVVPVDDEVITATLPHLPTVVADMVRFQRLTGCRPGEVRIIRPSDVDRSGEVWQYCPARHKMEHHDRERLIYIGRKAQEILLPYLLRDPQAYCFTPTDSEKKRKAQLRANRKTPVQPSQLDRRKRRPKVQADDRYTKDSFNRAVGRACDLADKRAHKENPAIAHGHRIVPRWTPNQLRHTAATEIRKRFGLEAAQVCLGHSRADVTQVYAERDQGLAAKIMSEVG